MWFNRCKEQRMSKLFKKRVEGMRKPGRRIPVIQKANQADSTVSIFNNDSIDSDKLDSEIKPRCFDEIAYNFVKRKLDNRPFINIKLFNKIFSVLLDSGASVSVVGKDGLIFIKDFNLQVDKSDLQNITTADGALQTVTGVVNLPICLGNSCQIIKALVVPTLQHAFILGSDFARKFEILIDFKNDSWVVQSKLSNENIALLSNHTSVCPMGNNSQLISLERLSCVEQSVANEIINSFTVISSEIKLGRTNKIVMNIDTGDAKPFKKKQYVLSPYMLKILNSELDEMLKLGVVEPSNSPWCSPVLLVKKKNGEHRFCFDGRALNEVTKHDSYPLPQVDRILNMLRDAKFISSIDLRKAFWQIPLDESSKEKTAFSVTGRGLFHFNVMPFGLCNAAQTQQRLVDTLFGPKYENKIHTYLDDLLITSSSFEEHVQLLCEVREILMEANLTINLKKCEFFKSSLKFLGFVVSEHGLHTDPDKVSVMLNYPRPRTSTEIKRFTGMCSWYRRFINGFSTLVSPLNDLIKGKKKKQAVLWTPEAEEAFVKIKEALVSAPILCQPDFNQPFTIQCDASDTGVGGVLTQVLDGEERVIAYASRTLSKTERFYSVTERELLSVIFCVEKFRPYVEGVKFQVITDHHSLLWLNNIKNPSGRLARWAVRLRQFTFDLIHRKGSSNVVPDALSRIPHDTIEISVLQFSTEDLDPWYNSLLESVRNKPEDYPQWKIEQGLLYKHTPSKLPTKTNISDWKLLVPKCQRLEVLESCHNPPTSAHLGFYKTLARVQQQCYWPKMRADTLKFVRKCLTCGSQKHPNTSPMGLMGAEKDAQCPWQIISVDIMGPFPRSSNSNAYLLVVADWLTKYTLLHPMRKATAQNVVKFMENAVFLTFGVPQLILCDNGTQFAGSVFKKLADQYQVQKIWYTPRYSPQCNFVERTNKTIGTAIRCYIKEHKDWDKELTKIQHALNTAKHEVTGFTPSYLNFGRHVPLSGKYYGDIQSTVDMEISPGDRASYAADLVKLSSVFGNVRSKIHTAYKRNANSYNLRRKDISFKEGDKVWKRNKILSDASAKFSAKLAPKYVLCKVRKKISKLVYELVNMDNSSAGNWHIKDLKPYLGSNSNVSIN